MIKDSDNAEVIRPSEFEQTKEALKVLRLGERLKVERQTHRDLAVVVHQSLDQICELEESLERCRLDVREAENAIVNTKANSTAAELQNTALNRHLNHAKIYCYALTLICLLLIATSWNRIAEQVMIWIPAASDWLT